MCILCLLHSVNKNVYNPPPKKNPQKPKNQKHPKQNAADSSMAHAFTRCGFWCAGAGAHQQLYGVGIPLFWDFPWLI